ncbi:unnamed protein product [Urochloa humidicola]
MALNPYDDIAFRAALNGNLRLLKQMAGMMDLREVKHPNIGGNLLHFAAAKDRVEICRFLVEESVEKQMNNVLIYSMSKPGTYTRLRGARVILDARVKAEE